MSDLDSEVRAGVDIIFLVADSAAILQLNRPAILTDDLDAELADFLDALRAADMPTLLAIRDTIRQVR